MQTNGKTPHQLLIDAIERDRARLERHLSGLEVTPESTMDQAELDSLAQEVENLALAASQLSVRLAAVARSLREHR